jgi:hypothetical protein
VCRPARVPQSNAACLSLLLDPGAAALDEEQQHKNETHTGHDSDNRK